MIAGTGFAMRKPSALPFQCDDCHEQHAYNQRTHVFDRERGRLVVCRHCATERKRVA